MKCLIMEKMNLVDNGEDMREVTNSNLDCHRTLQELLPKSLASLDMTEMRKYAKLYIVNEYNGDICTDGVEIADYTADFMDEIESFRWCFGNQLKRMLSVSEELYLLKDVNLNIGVVYSSGHSYKEISSL
ncbi:Hypothetical predicted protein, partial [Paramuricea clavata]